MKKMVVFCGSSTGTDPQVVEAAYLLGATLAQRGIGLVYGAARVGIMGEVARGALENGGEVIGVIPAFLKRKEVVHTGLTQLIVTRTMHERKLRMNELSDSVMTLPGGFGTLEELFEMITWAQLGLHRKPIGILNVNGYFDELLRLVQKMVALQFLKPENHELLLVNSNVPDLLLQMAGYTPKPVPKWIQKDQI